MTLKLTDEQRQALEQNPGVPVEVEDDQTQKVYLVVSRDGWRELRESELKRELQIGFDEVDAGLCEEWDVAEILAEAHRRHAARKS